ncbi:unnamed protein product [Polarella glacialis]|nr:unnamed protein product [Polarella glacialis]
MSEAILAQAGLGAGLLPWRKYFEAMDLRRWRLHVLVLTTGVFGIFEASSTPAALGWRVAAPKTPQHWAWDVGQLIFNTDAGPLQIGGPQGCEVIDSGSVSDAVFGGVPGYGSAQIFNNNNNSLSKPSGHVWGGRSNGSLFFVGLQCQTPVVVHSVQINQVASTRFAQISVQAHIANNERQHIDLGKPCGCFWTTLFEAQLPSASSVETVFNDHNISGVMICAEACKKDGFCCNDPWVGSNQMISCSQACLMRASGLAAPSCSKLCARNGSSGCAVTSPVALWKGPYLSVEGNSFGLCSSCADLTNSSKCTHGVASPEACFAGCALSPPTVAVAAVAGAMGHKSDGDHALMIVAVTVPICLACFVGLTAWCCYGRRKSSDPHAHSTDATQANSLPRLLRAAFPSQLCKAAERKRDLDPCWAATSVAQLGELRQLAMAALGTEYWTATMHDINRVVLQPLCQRTGKCYAHVVNFEELLYITVFVSHAWLENFEQFFQSINSAFQDWTVKPNLWICATALLQSTDPTSVSLQVGAGVSPNEAPFTKALAKAEKLLIVRNATVDLYERIWCCWEFFLAYQQGMIHRPGAVMVVGPSMFGTGTKEVDITSARSSNIGDKRKILEHISKTASYQVINEKLTEIKYFNGRTEGKGDLETNCSD